MTYLKRRASREKIRPSRGGNAKPRKVRFRLTDEQRELAAKAMEHLDKALAAARRKYPLQADMITACLDERITQLIPTFDPAKSSLSTWAINQVTYAVRDARRTDWYHETDLRAKNKLSMISLSHPAYDQGVETLGHSVEANNKDDSDRVAADETAEHILRPLPPLHRDMIRLYVKGYNMREISSMTEVSESRISQIFTACRALIRSRLEAMTA